MRRALFEGSRRGDESIAQSALRREQEFAMAEKYVTIPDNLKGQRSTFAPSLPGPTDYRAVSQALRVFDLDEESLTQKGKSSHFVGMRERGEPESSRRLLRAAIWSRRMRRTSSLRWRRWTSTRGPPWRSLPPWRRSARSEEQEAEVGPEKNRRHFSDNGSRPFASSGKRSMNIEAIKKVSRCSICGDRGPWAEDCKKPYRSKAERLEQEKGSKGNGKASAFVFLGSSSSDTPRPAPFMEAGTCWSPTASTAPRMTRSSRTR